MLPGCQFDFPDYITGCCIMFVIPDFRAQMFELIAVFVWMNCSLVVVQNFLLLLKNWGCHVEFARETASQPDASSHNNLARLKSTTHFYYSLSSMVSISPYMAEETEWRTRSYGDNIWLRHRIIYFQFLSSAKYLKYLIIIIINTLFIEDYTDQSNYWFSLGLLRDFSN